MSIVNLTFRTVFCKDCGEEAPEANLSSFSTMAPPPDTYSYDGACPKCYSKNTEIVDPFELNPRK